VKIAQNKVVSMQYQIADTNGEVLDAGEPGEEWCFLVGADEIPPGLEKALEGHQEGDTVSVTLSPDDAYGPRDESLIETIDKSDLGDDMEVKVGDQLEAETEEDWTIVKVIAVDEDTITVDGNHMLAGKALKFDVTITEVRDATEEEIAHGHAHGDGCVEDYLDDEDYDEDDFDEDDEGEEDDSEA
jgi:FKBP-type peptidyl-prolyl cis-trans isomerase SlyD